MQTQSEEVLRQEPDKIWNAAFISVFIANMLMFLGQQMMNTLVAKYANFLGAQPSVVGFITSSFAYTALLFKVFAAPAIDRLNKKYVLAGALLVMAASFFGYSMSHSVQPLLGFRLLQGAGQAFTATCCLALASECLPRDKMASGIAYFSLAQAICQSLGPTMGLSLAKSIGYNATFAIGAVIMVCAAVAAFMIKTPAIPKQKEKKPFSVKSIIAVEAILPAVLAFFLSMANYNINSFLAIYGAERGCETNIGYFFTVYALTMLASRPLVGKLADKYGMTKMIIAAMGCFAAAFLLISISTNIWMFLLSAFVSAFGYGACHPLVQALCMKCTPPEKRGAGSITNYIGQDLGNLVGPTFAGFVVERTSYAVMWRVMTIPILFAIALVFISRTRIARAENGGK